jgi:dihydroflavonol-4-reductase
MIAVTGGTGLIGSHLLFDLTSKGYKVRALKRPTSDVNKIMKIFSYYTDKPETHFEMINWVEGDILDLVSLEELFEGVDTVYHAAAFVSFNRAKKKTILNNNIYGTANVVNACLSKGVSKLCHVSSVAALGHSADGFEADENLIWSPEKHRSYYSISKFHSEMEVWRGIEEGLHAVIVNPSLVLGPGNWNHGSSSIFSTLYKGLRFYTPGTTGFVDVRDVTKAMIMLMESNLSGERYILNAENCSFKKVFQQISTEFKRPIPTIEIKPWMGTIALQAAWLKSLITGKPSEISRETISSGFKKMLYSNDKIKKQFDFNFIPVEKTIRDTAAIFLNDSDYRK